MTGATGGAEPSNKLTILGMVAILTTLTMWASSYVVVRSIALDLLPSSLAFLRIFFGALALTVVFLGLRRRTRKTVRLGAVIWSFPMGLFLFVGFTLSQNWAGQHIDAGTISILVNLAPLIVAIGAGMFFGEGFPWRLFLGIAVSFGGILLIVYGSSTTQFSIIGVSAGVAAAFCYGIGMLVQKKALQYEDSIGSTCLASWIGVLVLSPFAPQAVTEVSKVSSDLLLLIIYIGMGPMALGFWMWGYALTVLPAGQVAATSLTVPALAILLSAIFLSEVPPWIAILGGVLCIGGVLGTQKCQSFNKK